jgi:hypothetical protein
MSLDREARSLKMRNVGVSPSLVADVLADTLQHFGIAVNPPMHVQAVAEVLDQAGRRKGEQSLFEAQEIASWQPCLLSVRVPRR